MLENVGTTLREGKDKVRLFFRESWQELKKVSWPTRKETVSSTVVVIVFILLTGVYLAGVDAIISWLMTATLK